MHPAAATSDRHRPTIAIVRPAPPRFLATEIPTMPKMIAGMITARRRRRTRKQQRDDAEDERGDGESVSGLGCAVGIQRGPIAVPGGWPYAVRAARTRGVGHSAGCGACPYAGGWPYAAADHMAGLPAPVSGSRAGGGGDVAGRRVGRVDGVRRRPEAVGVERRLRGCGPGTAPWAGSVGGPSGGCSVMAGTVAITGRRLLLRPSLAARPGIRAADRP